MQKCKKIYWSRLDLLWELLLIWIAAKSVSNYAAQQLPTKTRFVPFIKYAKGCLKYFIFIYLSRLVQLWELLLIWIAAKSAWNYAAQQLPMKTLEDWLN